jgi:hypothetical protein
MVHTVYVLSVLFSATVGVVLCSYGSYYLISCSDETLGTVSISSGAIVLLGLLFLQWSGLTGTLPAEVSSLGSIGKVLAIFSIVGAIFSVDYILARLWPLVETHLLGGIDDGVSKSRRAALTSTFGAVTVGLLGATSYLHSRTGHGTTGPSTGGGPPTIHPTESSDFSLEGIFETPERPTSLAFSDRGQGYLTTLDGSIFRFEPPSSSNDSIRFEEVASGIRFPQGIEIVDNTLYTVDIGELREDNMETLRNSNAEVLAFDVTDDGTLDNRRVVVSGLPVINRDHSPNGITLGPDGRLYLSIGHFEGGWKEERDYEPDQEIHQNMNYLGTIVSFDPDGSNVEVMASGLRNVYDISFDEDGHLYGTDNDGETGRSLQYDVLYHIEDDGFYGFPEYGTFDESGGDEEIEEPLWVFDSWPSGMETAEKVGYESGILAGLWKRVVFVPLAKDDEGPYVPEPARDILLLRGDFPTIVNAGPNGRLYVSAFNKNEVAIFGFV